MRFSFAKCGVFYNKKFVKNFQKKLNQCRFYHLPHFQQLFLILKLFYLSLKNLLTVLIKLLVQ